MSGPYPSEQIDDPEFEGLIANICLRPGMFVASINYGMVCAYLDGFNSARSQGPLLGFREWLVVRFDEGNNLVWPGLARLLLPGGSDSTDEQAIRELGSLLAEFLEFRKSQGLTVVFRDYSCWLLRRSWYDGPLRPRTKD